MKSNKKTALVTGAASGLGFEFSKLLANDGYDLILVDKDLAKLNDTKSQIQKKFNVGIKVSCHDLSKQISVSELNKEIEGSSIDVLINNAGFGLFGEFAHSNWQREEDMINLHIVTTSRLTKLILKGMLRRHSGKIMNVSSLAAFQPGPLMSIYYASKAFILSFSEAISNELKGTGVTVTALCPGTTKTGFQKVVSNGGSRNRVTLNMASAKTVANYGYNAMMKGKSIAIPGVINKMLATLNRLLPRHISTSIIRKIQEKNRPKNFNSLAVEH